MKTLVTGVAGFVGSSLAERLLAAGHSVIGVDCFTPYYDRAVKENNLQRLLADRNFAFHAESLCSAPLTNLLTGVEWVFHQAAQAGVRASWGADFESYCQHNIIATQRLLEAARSSEALKQIVYASSSSVYGNAERYPTPEDILPQPVSPYGVTKLAAEQLMVLYNTEFSVPTVSLRYFTVYGPRQRPDMAFNRFLRAGLEGQELMVFGDGNQVRDFTYIDDIVTANLAAAEKGEGGAVYNIGGGTQASVNDVLDIIRQHIPDLKVRYSERQAGDARRTCADTRRAVHDLGFAPQVSLSDGIARELQWMQSVVS